MLDRKKILITGATSGIGLALSKTLLAKGASIIAIGRNRERLNELVSLAPDRVQDLAFDMQQFSDYRSAFSEIDKVDGVVHSAGIVENNPIKYFSLEKYQRIININQTAPLLLVSELVRTNRINEKGSIIFLGSITGTKIGMKGTAAYAASKAALVGYSKVLALELAHKLIRVNCVSPGMVATELVENASQLSAQNIKDDMARYPLGKRYAKPDEVAKVITFLLSDDSEFVTGENILIDGGYCLN